MLRGSGDESHRMGPPAPGERGREGGGEKMSGLNEKGLEFQGERGSDSLSTFKKKKKKKRLHARTNQARKYLMTPML